MIKINKYQKNMNFNNLHNHPSGQCIIPNETHLQRKVEESLKILLRGQNKKPDLQLINPNITSRNLIVLRTNFELRKPKNFVYANQKKISHISLIKCIYYGVKM